ncbi:cold-shock protein [Salinispora mooreana]|uniref:cold-shock protein n=1 Tax=Salinispora mooreana TaxID=999545 RepID=UPI00035DFD68|nr:cold shock domain-containing protein [Salinispora mooreana]
MVEKGTIVRFDDVRGYGFIAPFGGGDDVFVHANDFGDQRHQVAAGMRVSYEVVQSERGLKVASVVLETAPAAPNRGAPSRPQPLSDEDGECDVLAVEQFDSAVTELLLANVPSMTGAQIVEARRALVAMARQYGWVED